MANNLIPPQIVQQLINFSALDVCCALANSGYPESGVVFATFIGINQHGSFVFDVAYEDPINFEEENQLGRGKVYITPKFEALSGSWKFDADY